MHALNHLNSLNPTYTRFRAQSRTTQSSRSAAAAAAGGRAGRYRQQQQQDSTRDLVIAPVETNWSSNDSSYAASGRTDRGSARIKPSSSRHEGRRGPLVKLRVPPRRYRLRRSFDSPLDLHIRPSDPEFEGRLTSEINSVYGPRRLNKLIADFSPHFTPSHAASAISLLAGLVTGKALSSDELEANYRGPAAKVAAVFEDKVALATVKDSARVTYSLARLQLHMPHLLSAVEAATQGQLSVAPPQALAGLAVGFAHWGYRPSEAWIHELCLEAFADLSGFGAQDLANLLFSLACWGTSVSQPFLQRCLTAFRGHWGAAAATPAALVRFMYAVTQLPACQPLPPKLLQLQPEGAPVYLHHEAYRQQRELQLLSDTMGLSSSSEVAAVAAKGAAVTAAAAAAQASPESADSVASSSSSSSQQDLREAAGLTSSSSRSSSAVATYRLPSFNWLTAFLAECRRQIDRFKPAELSTLLWCCAALNHTPDLIFMEAWYRSSAIHMHAFTPATLAAAVQALGMLQPGKDVPGAVSGRWLQLVLQHSQQQLRAGGVSEPSAAAAAGAGDGQVLQQQQQQQQGGLSISASDLSKLLWGFAELKIWPGKPWLEAWLKAAAGQLHTASPSDLSDVVWALARLRFSPDDAWMSHLTTAINNHLQGFSLQGLAVVIWGYTRLGFRPDRVWLLRFRAVAGPEESPASSSSSSGQQLAHFVAAFLAQQNRQRFAEGNPYVNRSGGVRGRQGPAGRQHQQGQQQQQVWSQQQRPMNQQSRGKQRQQQQ